MPCAKRPLPGMLRCIGCTFHHLQCIHILPHFISYAVSAATFHQLRCIYRHISSSLRPHFISSTASTTTYHQIHLPFHQLFRCLDCHTSLPPVPLYTYTTFHHAIFTAFIISSAPIYLYSYFKFDFISSLRLH